MAEIQLQLGEQKTLKALSGTTEPARASDLTEITGETPLNVGKSFIELAKGGLAELVDKRKRLWRITDSGKQIAATIQLSPLPVPPLVPTPVPPLVPETKAETPPPATATPAQTPVTGAPGQTPVTGTPTEPVASTATLPAPAPPPVAAPALAPQTVTAPASVTVETPPAETPTIPWQADLFRREGESLGVGTKKGDIRLDAIVRYVERLSDLDDLNSVTWRENANRFLDALAPQGDNPAS